MCMQCAATAATAVGTAAGLRAWIRGHAGVWLTPARMRAVTILLATAAVIASGATLGGSG
jgi:phage tail sheath protein FI